jgi:hypothetical protein
MILRVAANLLNNKKHTADKEVFRPQGWWFGDQLIFSHLKYFECYERTHWASDFNESFGATEKNGKIQKYGVDSYIYIYIYIYVMQ